MSLNQPITVAIIINSPIYTCKFHVISNISTFTFLETKLHKSIDITTK